MVDGDLREWSWFVWVLMVEVFDVIFCREFGSRDPSEFFISTFITQPLNTIEKRASEPTVEFGVKDLCNLIPFFTVDFDWRWRWLGMIGNGIGFHGLQLRDMEYGMNRMEIYRKLESEGMGSRLSNDIEWSKEFLREFHGRASSPDVLSNEVDFITYFEIWSWRLSLVHLEFVVRLSKSDFIA